MHALSALAIRVAVATPALLFWPLAAPTATPVVPADQGPVGISGGLFYLLLLLGTVLFLGAFFYGRRMRKR